MHDKPLTLAFPPQGFLERTDPRLKVLCLLVWVVCVVTSPMEQWPLPVAYAAVLLVLLAGNVRLMGRFIRRFGSALPFIFAVVLLLPFFKEGEAVWRWGPLTVTREGGHVARQVGATACLCVGAVALVWASTSEAGLLRGLRGIRLPAGFVAVFGFMLRYLHVLRPELHRLTDARAARTIGGSGPGPLRSLANVVGTLFLRAHDRAGHVADAMALRGFDGRWRTLGDHHWHAVEVVGGIGFIVVVIAVRWLLGRC